MRILALALGVPFPPVGGGLTRTFHLLRALAPYHEVVLAAFTFEGETLDPPPFAVQVAAVPWQWTEAYKEMVGEAAEPARQSWQRLTFDTDNPWFVSVMDGAAMETQLAELTRTRFDLVLLEGTPLAAFLPSLPIDVPRVLDLFDVHSVMAARAVDEEGAPDREARRREAARTLAFERHAVQACQTCLAVSGPDADAARRLLGAGEVHVVPNGVETSYFQPSATPPEPGRLLFTGRMGYRPNADAAIRFARRVLPLIQRRAPHATFHVVGDGPPPLVRELASPSVVVHGRVDDVRLHQHMAEVVVVPIDSGGGTRLKVLEAAACGKPVVSSPLGVDGLAFQGGEEVLIAGTDEAMAAAVVELLENESRRLALGRRARAVALRYDWGPIGESFRAIVERVGRNG